MAQETVEGEEEGERLGVGVGVGGSGDGFFLRCIVIKAS